jgi:hypothetical protein
MTWRGTVLRFKQRAGTNLFRRLQKLRDSLDDLDANEVRFVKVPFFGIGFDINDLGMFSGLGFSTILLILAFSLKRIEQCTLLLFSFEKRKHP